MKPPKTQREKNINEKYYKWILSDGIIPQRIVDNYKREVELLKRSYETKTA